MIPNILTMTRLLLVPLILYLALSPVRLYNLWALIFFAIAALTDWLDGMVARATNKSTELGAVLDPLSDRVLIVAAGIAVFIRGELPLWTLAVLLSREILVATGFTFLYGKGIKIPVSGVGKTATAFLMTSIFVLLINLVYHLSRLSSFGRTLFYLGLILYIIAAFDYLKKGINLIRKGSRTRSTEES